MRITRIELSRSYADNETFNCTVNLQSDYGEIKLKIPNDRVQTLVEGIADLIVGAGKDVAENLTRQAMERTAIEHKPDIAP